MSNPRKPKNAPEEISGDQDANRDPMTGTPGAHPLGVGTGAATGGGIGAALGGAVAGPAGAAVGGVVGAVAGGLAGKGMAEGVNPTVEDEYWRRNHHTRPYAASGTYEEFRPAYQYGWESFTRYRGRKFEEVEADLRRDWETDGRRARLEWDRARGPARDAWARVERAVPRSDDESR
jgi:hypothetical protein